jgi:four helix bundle protein
MEQRNIIIEKSFEFALKIIEFAEFLESQRKFVVANQILKSGTTNGANVREAQSAERKADFIHKLKIADKEAIETGYWLDLCKFSNTYPDQLETELIEIKKLSNAILSSSKK